MKIVAHTVHNTADALENGPDQSEATNS
jgi:hypothetical protein